MTRHALLAALLVAAIAASRAQTPPAFDVHETSIAQIHGAREAGRLTCRALVEQYLRRIDTFDTGNSIRGPSSHQALVGIRSTMGLTSRAGVMPLNLLADIAGPMARTMEDAVTVFQVVVGSDPADPVTAAADSHVGRNFSSAGGGGGGGTGGGGTKVPPYSGLWAYGLGLTAWAVDGGPGLW